MHAARRQRLLDVMEPGSVALIQGASLKTRSADTEFPFRQDSDFWYLTGFDHPNAVAVLRADGSPGYTLFVEPRDKAAETWTGYRPGVEGAVADYDADEAHEIGTLKEKLAEIIAGASRIYHVLGRNASLDTRLLEIQEGMRLRSRAGQVPAETIADPRHLLHEMRLHKEPAELELMRRAAAITAEAHHEAARAARGGTLEYEIQALLEYTFRRRGASGPAYGSIVGGGRNATILHYIRNDQPLVDGELLLIDAGCELEGYASDVTRGYPVGGRFDGPGREIYEVVLAAQEACMEASLPGTTLDALHQLAVRRLVEGMLAIGLLQGSADDVIESGGYQPYYMHRTSHWLGLDVHDVGAYTIASEPRKLEPGMVFTIEPGLYVPADDEQAPAAFRGIGVRIEDDVAITDEGHENLTAAIPKKASDIEAWMAQ